MISSFCRNCYQHWAKLKTDICTFSYGKIHLSTVQKPRSLNGTPDIEEWYRRCLSSPVVFTEIAIKVK